MRFELDTEARSAYLRVKEGRVSSTEELSSLVFADVDRAGDVLGIEFLGPDALYGAAELVSRIVEIPPELEYTVDNEKDFEVEVSVDTGSDSRKMGAARLHFAFAQEILTRAQNLADIPTNSLVILVESGSTQAFDHLLNLAEQRRRGGRSVILRPLDVPFSDRTASHSSATDERNTTPAQGLLLNLDRDMLARLDRIAHTKGVDSASVAKRWIEEGIERETERDPRLTS